MKKYSKLIAAVCAFIILIAGSSFVYKELINQYGYGTKLNTESNEEEQKITVTPDEGSVEEGKETEEAVSDHHEEAAAENGTEDKSAPDFKVVDAEDEEITLSSFAGKPVVLNFWASWCPPCKSEMPDFQKAYEQYGTDIAFVMLNLTDGVRETKEKAQSYIAEQGFTFPTYYDVEQNAANTYFITSIPTTYFIDENGDVIASAKGMLDAETLEKGISMITK